MSENKRERKYVNRQLSSAPRNSRLRARLEIPPPFPVTKTCPEPSCSHKVAPACIFAIILNSTCPVWLSCADEKLLRVGRGGPYLDVSGSQTAAMDIETLAHRSRRSSLSTMFFAIILNSTCPVWLSCADEKLLRVGGHRPI
jgi:hypothetical protein